jgi:hypothetical protein
MNFSIFQLIFERKSFLKKKEKKTESDKIKMQFVCFLGI